MTRLLAALAILVLVLLVTWALWQRTHAAEARAAADSDPSSAVTRKARARFQSNFTDRQSMRKRISEDDFWSIHSADMHEYIASIANFG